MDAVRKRHMSTSCRLFLLALGAWLAVAPSALATYPGQNGRIAFTAENKPTAEATHGIGLFSIPSDVPVPLLGLTQLTSGDDYSISYSADGQKIAFGHYPGGYLHATQQDLYIANADGSSPTLVLSSTPNGHGVGAVSLSPDASQILFDDSHDLYKINSDGSGLQLLATRAIYGKWSPDGTKIAYSQFGPSNVYDDLQIYVANADGSDPFEMKTGLGFSVGVNWSPDGTRLLFAGPGKRHWNDLYAINIDGSGFARLTQTGQNEASAVWSPDGTAIAYTRGFLRTSLWRMNLQTMKAKRIKTRFPRSGFADWQPVP